jgi:hypothetical protein
MSIDRRSLCARQLLNKSQERSRRRGIFPHWTGRFHCPHRFRSSEVIEQRVIIGNARPGEFVAEFFQ